MNAYEFALGKRVYTRKDSSKYVIIVSQPNVKHLSNIENSSVSFMDTMHHVKNPMEVCIKNDILSFF
jgi:hypothetical protein